MDSRRWQMLKPFFGAALDLSPDKRAEFLDKSCPDDIRRDLEMLLSAHDRSGRFMKGLAVGEVADVIVGEPEQLRIGQVISHFKVVGFLGAGGMGKVYLAQDTKLNRKVALKLLSSDFPDKRELLMRFEREACAASALNHPNIITVHEIFVENGLHVISTEFVEGVTLRERLSQGPISPDETIEIASQIAAALGAAHSAGIVHRDVKPENVMIRPDGLVKVLDFGLAKSPGVNDEGGVSSLDSFVKLANVTDPQVVVGTVQYLSPEQATGHIADRRSDIYSFGVTLYEMLAGRVPFAGETASASVRAMLGHDLVPVPECPAALWKIVKKTLEPNPESRYQTMGDVIGDLNELKRNNISAPDALAVSRRRPFLPNRFQFAFGALLLFVAFAVPLSTYLRQKAGSPAPVESIAVLPFANRTGDADLEYLSDGSAESLINRLARFPKLKVRPMSSVIRFKEESDKAKAGRELGVQVVVSGTVAQRGDELIISVELVDLRTDQVLWGERYQRKKTEIQSTQREIASGIVERLNLGSSGSGEQMLGERYTDSDEAYRLYLKGRYFGNRLNPSDLEKAIEFFNEAVALDPRFALAYAGIADAYVVSLNTYPPRERIPKAKQAALTAISLDNELGDAHRAYGMVLLLYEYDHAAAKREFELALELNPSSPTAHQSYALLLFSIGEFDEGIEEFHRALDLDPLSLAINWSFGLNLNNARRYEEALAQTKRTLELEPNLIRTYGTLALVYQSLERYDESVDSYARAQELAGRPDYAAALREVYRKDGMKGFWRYVTDERTRVCTPTCAPYMLATYYVQLGEYDKAFAELDKAYEQRNYQLYVLNVDPRFDALRGDPRFREMLKKIGFRE